MRFFNKILANADLALIKRSRIVKAEEGVKDALFLITGLQKYNNGLRKINSTLEKNNKELQQKITTLNAKYALSQHTLEKLKKSNQELLQKTKPPAVSQLKNKIIVIGNCQIHPLKAILMLSKNFNDKFWIEHFPPVHVMSQEDVQRLHISLSSCHHLVVQRISEHYRNNIGLGVETLRSFMPGAAHLITWPSIYFSSYNPELFQIKNSPGSLINQEFDYHHRLILSCFSNGYSIAEAAAAINDSRFFSKNAEPVETVIENLRQREQTLDIKISHFITEHYKKQRLFWTFNHPSKIVVLEVARAVLNILNLKDDLQTSQLGNVVDLNNTIYPISPAIRETLGLQFHDDQKYRIRNEWMDTNKIVNKYYSFYKSNQEIVALNQERVIPCGI